MDGIIAQFGADYFDFGFDVFLQWYWLRLIKFKNIRRVGSESYLAGFFLNNVEQLEW